VIPKDIRFDVADFFNPESFKVEHVTDVTGFVVHNVYGTLLAACGERVVGGHCPIEWGQPTFFRCARAGRFGFCDQTRRAAPADRAG